MRPSRERHFDRKREGYPSAASVSRYLRHCQEDIRHRAAAHEKRQGKGADAHANGDGQRGFSPNFIVSVEMNSNLVNPKLTRGIFVFEMSNLGSEGDNGKVAVDQYSK